MFKWRSQQELRRTRSERRLIAEQIPVNKYLPVIEAEADIAKREAAAVAERALALAMVSLKGAMLGHDDGSQEDVDGAIEKYASRAFFSPDELRFIDDPAPGQPAIVNASWRYECLWVMLWALGLVDGLARPDALCDVPGAMNIVVSTQRERFIASARLRPYADILDEADLIYRYHWATTDARINGRETPGGLIGGVVQERHYALNWLIGYGEGGWDDVPTDT